MKKNGFNLLDAAMETGLEKLAFFLKEKLQNHNSQGVLRRQIPLLLYTT